jgi:hypothetical protein
MSRIKFGLALLGVVLAIAVWYAFRPERAFLDVHVSESAPSGMTAVLSSGVFVPLAHEGRGLAEVVQLADGRRMLRFSNFETLNGPDVRVYLLKAASVRGDRELALAGFLDLGELKGNIGDQNYDIPAGTDLSSYRAVSVWCRRFGVNFTSASLVQGTPSRAPTGD